MNETCGDLPESEQSEWICFLGPIWILFDREAIDESKTASFLGPIFGVGFFNP